MTCTEQSLYYRQWTVPKPIHMDYNNRIEGRMDTFHPRRLLLSGPPQVCNKTRYYHRFILINFVIISEKVDYLVLLILEVFFFGGE